MSFTAPKDALQRIHIGQSFAEYDLVREDPYVFVSTAASLVATQSDNKKCFFVGRRGSGKTAIAYHILSKKGKSKRITSMKSLTAQSGLSVKKWDIIESDSSFHRAKRAQGDKGSDSGQ
jgi:Holliday junction resolvasome RuvABC ATP-dependent DNA helicase subunit